MISWISPKLKHFDIELVQRPLSLHVLTDIVLKNNTPLIKGKDLPLVNAVHQDLPAIYGDADRLQQVFYNLIGNAIKFTEQGHVKVAVDLVDKMIQVKIEDTGIGIPKDKEEAIFQEFEQADGSISRKFAGTGLGLSISKKLIELHGGQMWVESELGEGSTFFFSLPISKEKASTLKPDPESLGVFRELEQHPIRSQKVCHHKTGKIPFVFW
jgi:two-component system sensor histidine kinase ChiS